jgi:hypothetical protein
MSVIAEVLSLVNILARCAETIVQKTKEMHDNGQVAEQLALRIKGISGVTFCVADIIDKNKTVVTEKFTEAVKSLVELMIMTVSGCETWLEKYKHQGGFLKYMESSQLQLELESLNTRLSTHYGDIANSFVILYNLLCLARPQLPHLARPQLSPFTAIHAESKALGEEEGTLSSAACRLMDRLQQMIDSAPLGFDMYNEHDQQRLQEPVKDC